AGRNRLRACQAARGIVHGSFDPPPMQTPQGRAHAQRGLAFCLGPWYITLVVGRYSPAYGTRSPSICARPATDSVQARARRANVGRASGRMDMGHPQALTKRVVASYPPKLVGTSVTLRH